MRKKIDLIFRWFLVYVLMNVLPNKYNRNLSLIVFIVSPWRSLKSLSVESSMKVIMG